MRNIYTITLTPEQIERLHTRLSGDLWAAVAVPHALFAYKGDRVNVVAYESGKVVIQGKQTESFVENILEPEVTQVAYKGYEEIHHPEWFEPHLGLDESGKGDFFGPLVTACVVADGPAVRAWRKEGLADSKQLSDDKVILLDALIRRTPQVSISLAYCSMEKYNALMAKPKANLNLLLAWLHARALEEAMGKQAVAWGLLDQFSKRPLVQGYLSPEFKAQHPDFVLKMRTRAESDPIVAAASVVARAAFLTKLKALSQHTQAPLLKGAGPRVKAQATALVKAKGAGVLQLVAKCHFKTYKEVLRG